MRVSMRFIGFFKRLTVNLILLIEALISCLMGQTVFVGMLQRSRFEQRLTSVEELRPSMAAIQQHSRAPPPRAQPGTKTSCTALASRCQLRQKRRVCREYNLHELVVHEADNL